MRSVSVSSRRVSGTYMLSSGENASQVGALGSDLAADLRMLADRAFPDLDD